jgi:hypothetical protein
MSMTMVTSYEIKQLSPTNSIDAARQIDCNDEQQEREFASIRVSFDPDSNISEQRVSQE